jgi:hypothetical protein
MNRLVAILGIVAISAPWFAFAEQPPQDEPLYRLDSQYHQLPQNLVDRLQKEIPQPPHNGSRPYYCFGEGPIAERLTYCICYSTEACLDLRKTSLCTAKIGLIRPDIGVCRSNVESVTVVQRLADEFTS